MKELLKKPLPVIPADIAEKLAYSEITLTLFENKNDVLRKIIMTDQMARAMAEHCCIEYRNLCQILPALYKENVL